MNKSLYTYSKQLLNSTDKKQCKEAIFGLMSLYTQHIGIPMPEMQQSTLEAAHCLIDFNRTIKFIHGLHAAIQDMQELYPNQTINIFEAGCGPYATLMTCFTTIYSSDQVKFFLTDINPDALEKVNLLYNKLDITDYLIDTVHADCTTYQIPDMKFHIFISETLDASMENEPQIPIMNNLLPQMGIDTVFIPQGIKLTVQPDGILTTRIKVYKDIVIEPETSVVTRNKIYKDTVHFTNTN